MQGYREAVELLLGSGRITHRANRNTVLVNTKFRDG
jgi:hypothetical protein